MQDKAEKTRRQWAGYSPERRARIIEMRAVGTRRAGLCRRANAAKDLLQALGFTVLPPDQEVWETLRDAHLGIPPGFPETRKSGRNGELK